MRLICLLAFVTLELAAMQKVDVPEDTKTVAKSIVVQSGRPITKTNVKAVKHMLNAIKASPGIPDAESQKLTKLDSMKVKVNNFLNAAKNASSSTATPATGIIAETEKLVDEAVDFWAGNTTDAVIAQKRQKIASMITTGISLTGNATLLALTIYYGLGSKCTSGS
jgi:hypothetical protein